MEVIASTQKPRAGRRKAADMLEVILEKVSKGHDLGPWNCVKYGSMNFVLYDVLPDQARMWVARSSPRLHPIHMSTALELLADAWI